jgi:tryptophan-rich sensory protein
MTQIASRSQLRMSFLRYALVTVPLILLLGILSGRASNSGFGNPWFDALVKPDAMPPGWAFGVAWTILYILLGLSLALILHARGAEGARRGAPFLLCAIADQLCLVAGFLWDEPGEHGAGPDRRDALACASSRRSFSRGSGRLPGC